MIPNWYFESPVALVWPGLPLAPHAPDPLYFSFNHSVMSFSQDNKGAIPDLCPAHDVAPHWSLTPPKGQTAIVKLPLNFLHLIKHSREKKNGNPVKSPLSLMSKMAGQMMLIITIASPQCKALFGCHPALLTIHSFLTDGFIYSALKDSEITGDIDTAINCSSYVCNTSTSAWSCSFTGGHLQELFRLLTDIDCMLTSVFVKTTLSWQNMETFHAWSYGEELWLETEYKSMKNSSTF